MITHQSDLYRRYDDTVAKSECMRADKHAKLCEASNNRERIQLALVGGTMIQPRTLAYPLERFGVLTYSRNPSEINFVIISFFIH